MIGAPGIPEDGGSGSPSRVTAGWPGYGYHRLQCVLDRRIPAGLGATRARAHPIA